MKWSWSTIQIFFLFLSFWLNHSDVFHSNCFCVLYNYIFLCASKVPFLFHARTHACTHACGHSLTYSLIYSFTQLIYSLTHSLSLGIHAIAHSFTVCILCIRCGETVSYQSVGTQSGIYRAWSIWPHLQIDYTPDIFWVGVVCTFTYNALLS